MQLMPGGVADCTVSSSACLFFAKSSVSSSYALSKWSSIARLLRPVMKIMSVMPAAAASSTAYWISGLSTTGSISFGLAFVAGRKRVPMPATGNTAFVILRIVMIRPRVGLWSSGFCRAGLKEFPESFFVHDRYAKLLRLRELASRFLAGHDVIGLLRYAAGDFAAFRLDHRLGIVARELRQRSRQHEGKPCELARGRAHRHRVAPVHSGLAQGIDHLAIVPLGEEARNAFCDNRADVAHGGQLFSRGRHQRVEIAEMPGEVAGRRLAHLANAQGVDETGECGLLAFVDRGNDVGGGFVRHALKGRECCYVEPVDVGRRVHQPRIDELINQFFAEALDVDRAAACEMEQRLLALRRAEEPTGAARNGFVGQAHDCRAAD